MHDSRSDDKPGSVVGSYLSRPAVADRFKRSTFATKQRLQELLPYASCCGQGLPGCPCHHRHRWSLTPPFHPYRKEGVRPANDSWLRHKSFEVRPLFAAVYSLLHLPSDCSGHPLDGVLSCVQPGLSSRSSVLPATTCRSCKRIIA